LHKTLAPLSLFPFAPVAMKNRTYQKNDSFTLEATEAALNACAVSIFESVDPENRAQRDFGGLFNRPEGNPTVDKLRAAVSALVAEAQRLSAEAEEREANLVDAGKAIADALSSPLVTDAEAFEEVFSFASSYLQAELHEAPPTCKECIAKQLRQLAKEIETC
jgi:hypothetical protein